MVIKSFISFHWPSLNCIYNLYRETRNSDREKYSGQTHLFNFLDNRGHGQNLSSTSGQTGFLKKTTTLDSWSSKRWKRAKLRLVVRKRVPKLSLSSSACLSAEEAKYCVRATLYLVYSVYTTASSKSSTEVTKCTSSNILVWFGRDAPEKSVAGLRESLFIVLLLNLQKD